MQGSPETTNAVLEPTKPRVERELPAATDLLSLVLANAGEQRATDVHVDSHDDATIVRFRIDGLVRVAMRLPRSDGRRLMNQIKVAAEYTPEAVRTLRDGSFRFGEGANARHVRVTLVPEAPENESAHLRLLTPPSGWPHAEQLGLSEAGHRELRRVMNDPHGLVLVAGPTGAGKTTTLHALLELVDGERHIIASIEDPAEFDLPYVRQIQVDVARGVGMEDGLRALLRMDPDLICIGEIRDRISALIATRAALSGRMALATIHARDPFGAIHAMHNLGVPFPVLAACIQLVVAQNLVRKLCPHCAIKRPPHDAERAVFEKHAVEMGDLVCDPHGCEACGGEGYRGRTGVFEIQRLDSAAITLLDDDATLTSLRDRAQCIGKPLLSEVLHKVATGVTSMNEARRVLGSAKLASDELVKLHESAATETRCEQPIG